MSTLSLERVCLEVKQKGLEIPKVVQRQRSRAYKAVFYWIYKFSDRHGLVELDANRISDETGISRRQIYRAVTFLRRVNLLRPRALKTGRGNHSLYWLNWRKERKCASLSKRTKFKNHIHDRANRSNTQWNQKLKAFRELMQYSWLLPQEQGHCMGVLGRHLKSRSTEYARQLYDALARIIGHVDAPGWVMTIQDLCRWWMSVLKGLMGQKFAMETACAK